MVLDHKYTKQRPMLQNMLANIIDNQINNKISIGWSKFVLHDLFVIHFPSFLPFPQTTTTTSGLYNTHLLSLFFLLCFCFGLFRGFWSKKQSHLWNDKYIFACLSNKSGLNNVSHARYQSNISQYAWPNQAHCFMSIVIRLLHCNTSPCFRV